MAQSNAQKILIVEDDVINRGYLETLFQDAGYRVVSAVDGIAGLKKALDERPCLIISDVLMPGMDGFQLLRAVRNQDRLKQVPVIFFTGSYLEQKDRELARALGVTRYLCKPSTPAELLKNVREVLAQTDQPVEELSISRSLEEPVFLKLYNERLVSKLKSKMLESEETRLFFGQLLEGISDGVVVVNRSYQVLQVNSAAARILAADRVDLIGRPCFEAFHRRTTPCQGPHICPLPQICANGTKTVTILHTHFDSHGDEHHVEINASPVRNDQGEIVAMVETWRDIMDKTTDDQYIKLAQRLSEAQTHLKHMAITDELTGLRNRRYIIERLEEEFLRAKRSGRQLSLIMLDVDHFKNINDTYGHLFGDLVLRVIASRIKSRLRKHDILGRVGGEEFLVLCPDSSLNDTITVADRIRRAINDEPISNGVDQVVMALSAGVTMQVEEDEIPDRVFSRADTALYKAKQEGRNRVVVLQKKARSES